MPRRSPVSLPFAVPLLAAFLLLSCREAGTFKHEGHVTVTKGACDSCHGTDVSAPRKASAPDCSRCHRQGKRMYDDLAARIADEGARPGARKDVIFAHRLHADAGVACRTCHPAAPGGGLRAALPSMDACTGCHGREGVTQDCPACHRTIRQGRSPVVR